MADMKLQIKDAIIAMATLLKKEGDNRFNKNNLSISFEYNLPIKKISGIAVNSKIEIIRFMKSGDVSLYKIMMKIDATIGLDGFGSIGVASGSGSGVFRNEDKSNKVVCNNLFYENLFVKDNIQNLDIDDYINAVDNMYDMLPKLSFDSSLCKFTTELCIPIASLGILFLHDNIDIN